MHYRCLVLLLIRLQGGSIEYLIDRLRIGLSHGGKADQAVLLLSREQEKTSWLLYAEMFCTEWGIQTYRSSPLARFAKLSCTNHNDMRQRMYRHFLI